MQLRLVRDPSESGSHRGDTAPIGASAAIQVTASPKPSRPRPEGFNSSDPGSRQGTRLAQDAESHGRRLIVKVAPNAASGSPTDD